MKLKYLGWFCANTWDQPGIADHLEIPLQKLHIFYKHTNYYVYIKCNAIKSAGLVENG